MEPVIAGSAPLCWPPLKWRRFVGRLCHRCRAWFAAKTHGSVWAQGPVRVRMPRLITANGKSIVQTHTGQYNQLASLAHSLVVVVAWSGGSSRSPTTHGAALSPPSCPLICSKMAGWPMIRRRKSRSSQQSKRRTPLNKHDDCCCSALLIWPIQWTGRTWCCDCCSCHSVRSSVICCSHSSRLY